MKLVPIVASLAIALAAMSTHPMTTLRPMAFGESQVPAGSPASAGTQAKPAAATPEGVDLSTRVARLEQRTVRLEDRAVKLEDRAAKLEDALQRSENTVETLSKQLKAVIDTQVLLSRAIQVDPTGNLRVLRDLRMDDNILDDTTIVDCDTESTVGTRRRCTCPDGRVATGIELRPMSVSALPGPPTYNTALMCSRL